ncbi:hypothetical protein OAF73_00835 [Planctomycetota bacterium]|nr:hypothetical protein [Planctomycetota bacterium]
MKSKILVFGAGGHASVIVEALIRSGHHVVAGFIDEVAPDRRGEKIGEATILGGLEAVDDALLRGVGCAAVAIGDNAARQRLADFVLQKGMELPLIQDPSATI